MRRFVLVVSIVLSCGSTFAQSPDGPVTFGVPMKPDGFYLNIRAGGGPAHSVQVDTGSTGIVIGYPRVGQAVPLTAQEKTQYGLANDYILYNSSGNVSVGQWVFTSVEISGGSGNRVMVDRIPVLAVDHMCKMPAGMATPTAACLNAPRWKVDCGPPPDKRDPPSRKLCGLGMMGVGFDRGMGNSGVNPFLHTRQMENGTVRRGYIVSATGGITLGLTDTNVASFRFVPLQRVPNGNAYEWQQAPGCVTVTGGGITSPGPPLCGAILVDTGVDRMFVTYGTSFPAFQPPVVCPVVDLWQCEPVQQAGVPCAIYGGAPAASVTVTWPATNPAPPFSYSVQAPADFVAGGTAPSNVHLRQVAGGLPDPGENVFVNTSRQLLNMADYLYDASAGRIGFRRR